MEGCNEYSIIDAENMEDYNEDSNIVPIANSDNPVNDSRTCINFLEVDGL